MTRSIAKAFLVAALIMAGSTGEPAIAANLAVCGSVSGKAYFIEKGIVPKEKSRWSDDGISGGRTTLVKLTDSKYDILFVDSVGAITSTTQSGGELIKLRQGASDMTFLVYYPGGTIEVYTFFINDSDQARMMLLQSKGGRSTQIHKGAVFVGDCDFIHFD